MIEKIYRMGLLENELKYYNIEHEMEKMISIVGSLEFEIIDEKEWIKINDVLIKLFGYIVDKKVIVDVSESTFIYTSNGYCLSKHKNDIICLSINKRN